jgi:hypothetical protein
VNIRTKPSTSMPFTYDARFGFPTMLGTTSVLLNLHRRIALWTILNPHGPGKTGAQYAYLCVDYPQRDGTNPLTLNRLMDKSIASVNRFHASSRNSYSHACLIRCGYAEYLVPDHPLRTGHVPNCQPSYTRHPSPPVMMILNTTHEMKTRALARDVSCP